MHNANSNKGRVAPLSPAIHAVCNSARRTELGHAARIARATTEEARASARAAWEAHASAYAWALFQGFGGER
jgi:hypothetical protein